MISFIDQPMAEEIMEKYGSPVYVYSEKVLRRCCRDMMTAFKGRFEPSYSIKANSNLTLLKIIKEEGFNADAMSSGEIFMLEQAGFASNQIFFIANNVSPEEMKFAIDKGILVSVDSLAQLELYGKLNRGGRVAVRFNPGLGAGHCDKVITGGHKTKFGIQAEFWAEVKELIEKYELKLVGVNQHIGSLFLESGPYIEAAKSLLELVLGHFPGLEFIDFGGGFGVPYKDSEARLDYGLFTEMLFPVLDDFVIKYDNKNVRFKCEPGRYVVAECGSILGKVYSIKDNYNQSYVGTDIGFNVLMRPVLYDSYHQVRVVGGGKSEIFCDGPVSIVGNICESGDIIAHYRNVGPVRIGDIVEIMTAGAYGFSMASNYNCRLKPAEVLIRENGDIQLIRKADTLESLISNF
ncbi:MAG: diaminopimelate decarboxylase [Synergistaceae bacterium]